MRTRWGYCQPLPTANLRAVGAPPPPPPPAGNPFIANGVPYLHDAKVAELQAMWNGGVSPHAWATIFKNRADGVVSDDVGQWDLLTWKMTGTLSYGQAAVAQAWSNFHDLVTVNPGPDYVREYGWWFACCYPWLSSLMDGASGRPTTTNWLDRLDQWATAMTTGSPSGYEISVGDSDRCTTFYLFCRLVDRWTPLGNDYTGQLDPSVKAAFDDYWTRAEGGEWIESTEYNLGTVQLLHLAIWADDPDHYTGYSTWYPEAAETFKWMVTPDWLTAVAWGDCQEYNQARYYERIALASMYSGMLDAGSAKTSALNYLGQIFSPSYANINPSTSSNPLHLYRAVLFVDPRTIPSSPTDERPTGLRVCPGIGLVLYRDTGHRCLTYWIAWTPPFVDHYLYTNWVFRYYLDGEWVANHVVGYQLDYGGPEGYPGFHLHDVRWLQNGGPVSANLSAGKVTITYTSDGPDWNAPFTWPTARSLGSLDRIVEFTFPDLLNEWTYITANDVTTEGWWPTGVYVDNENEAEAAKAAGRVYQQAAIATVDVGGTAPASITGGYEWQTPGGLDVQYVVPDLNATKSSTQLTNATTPSMPAENWSNHDVYRLQFKDATTGTYVRESQYYFGAGTPPPIPAAPPPP